MDPTQISTLARLFRDNGDKILNSEFKLTLSGPLLRALNDSFTLIADGVDLSCPQSFQVVKPNNAKSEVYRDLQLVHDFVQKTIVLCITRFPGDDFFEGNIDISKFHSLRRLEVQKVNIKEITGIQPLRAQLQHLVCIRSLYGVEDIITYCGGDHSNGFVWNELKSADFSYNNLKTVDSSLEFVQWLQNLNLSHNQLTSVEAIKWLPNLKVLDLRFNRLTNIPSFHTEASRRLQILILSNNFIEDLRGISRLDALTELDLSNNCLLDHLCLLPLSTLATLKYLNLDGNPLSCHPKHRQATAHYLHKNTASVKFILDFEPLTKAEKSLTGNYQNYHSVLTSRLPSSLRSSGQSTPTKKSQPETPSSSVGSIKNFKLNDEEKEITIATKEKQKRLKARTVEIDESKSVTSDGNGANTRKSNVESKTTFEGCKDHLETKKYIEDLREKFGSGWLQNENAQMVQSMLGITESENSKTENVSPQKLINDLLNEVNDSQESTQTTDVLESTVLTSTPLNRSRSFDFSTESPIKEPKLHVKSEETVYESAIEKSLSENQTLYQSVKYDSAPVLEDIYPISIDESEISEPEENESTYIVRSGDNSDELVLTISDNFIKEKDALTTRTKTKWSLKILESCDRLKSNTLRINFDTIKKSKKERVYIVEEDLCQELEKCLREILSKQLLSEKHTVYRCISCSLQFCKENTYKRVNSALFCPECESTYIVEVNESPKTSNSPHKLTASTKSIDAKQTPTQENQTTGEKFLVEESASRSSIGSAGSLNESSSCSKISNSESSFDSNQSVAGSSTNEKDLDFSLNKNIESDVEILSNPSQSSIEVLDTIHSSRKTSEERRILRIPSLETIKDQSVRNMPSLTLVSKETSTDGIEPPPPPAVKEDALDTNGKKISLGTVNLTESSSSGSVTDSICTAYEQGEKHDTNQLGEIKPPQNRNNIEKENKREESIITSMLGGLFQSTSMLMSRSQKQTETETTTQCDKFKYNYNDFSDIDHRLKLYFYQSKFEDENEHFKGLIKGKIFNENNSTLSEGIVVISTAKLYVMEIIGTENDDISKWLKQIFSGTIDRIESIQLLPWKIGVSFKIKSWGCFMLILQDILRTDNLLLFFANNPFPKDCVLDYQISDKVHRKLSISAQEEQLKMFSLLNSFELTCDNNLKSFSPAGFFTTDTHLYITNSDISWLSCNSEASIELGSTQLMSNLVEIDKVSKNIFAINFLDETQDKCELWKCSFETTENAESCLNAIGQSWEKLFGVPLVSN